MTFFLAHGGGCSTTVVPVNAVVGGRIMGGGSRFAPTAGGSSDDH